MARITIVNKLLKPSAATAVNRDIIDDYNSQINTGAEGPSVPENAVICDRYKVMRRLDVASGEAVLYLCTDGTKRYAAKIYNRKTAIKPEVIERLKEIDSPYVGKLFEAGTYGGYPVEILEYYEKGSLQGRRFTEEELVSTVIPCINEGLHAIHEAGIIHKDLKPSNIMMNDDGKTVSIIDFGISSVIREDAPVNISKTGMTPEYSAPETFRRVFLQEADYYSFGITLFELFCGYIPYANMRPEEIEQYLALQRIPFPNNMPIRLQDLISALTYVDITKRGEKDNPNRRWTYEEVAKWLAGESQPIPGEGAGASAKADMPPFRFLDTDYSDPSQLVAAMAKNWEEGKKQLFRSVITAYFRTWNRDLARKCQTAEEEAARRNGKDDIIYWNLLYQLDPELQGFYWMGRTFESLPAFGRSVLDSLWDKDREMYPYFNSVLSEKVLSLYVSVAAPDNEELKKAAAALEDSYELEKNNGTDMMRTYYYMGYTLSGQRLLLLDGEKIRTVGELAAYLRKVQAESLEKFKLLAHRLIDYDGNLDVQLEAWLDVIGKRKEIEIWKEAMNG